MIRCLLFLLLMNGCANGPEIPILFWSVSRQQFEGKDAQGNNMVCVGTDPKCNKLVATTPEGQDELLQWMKRNCK